jgi:retinol dehydrogenase 12
MPTVVVTGATGAIGSAAVSALRERRANVVALSRPALDLSSMRSVRATARSLPRIDVLLHLASVFTTRWQKTPEGFELMLATNYLGPFLLTNLLRDRLLGGRVITVTAPSTTHVDVDRLLDRDRFHAFHTFGATKAASLMFTLELARRAKRWDVRANAFHPGVVRSELMREASRPIRIASRLFARDPRQAGIDLAELALSPAFAGTTGWFFKGTRRIDPPKSALEETQQSALWRKTATLLELESGF